MNRTIIFQEKELQLINESGSREGGVSATFAMNDGSNIKIMRLKYWSHGELEINSVDLISDELEEIAEMGEQPAGVWQLPAPNILAVLEDAWG